MEFKCNILPHVQEVIDKSIATYKDAMQYRFTDQTRYIQVLNNFYAEESLRRTINLQKVNRDPQNIKQVLAFMSERENIINTMVDWVWTYDPRLAPIGLPTLMPWVPWPIQIEFIEWVYNRYLNQEGGLVEKSRDAGATWLICAIYVQEWRWVEGFAGGLGSNKLDNVDKKDDPDCLFEKMRSILKALPKWWFPKKFISKKHNKLANLINPELGSNIAGQGGKEIGRGGRRSIYTVDEKASLEFPEEADKALSQNTNCQIDVSTPKGMNNFGRKRWSGKIKVFIFDWRDDPRKTQEWYEREKKRLRREVLAQEIDRDYHASVEGIFIKPEWVRAAVELKLKAKGPCTAGLDVAAGGKNESALAIRKGPVVKVKAFDIDNGVDLVHGVIDICNPAQVEYLHYDKPGVGHAVKSTIERTERKMEFLYYGWEPSGSPSDKYYDEYDSYAKDIFKNARAEAVYNTARRFEKTWEHVSGTRVYDEQELISIENDSQLIAEISNPLKIPTETGKIRVESKEQMLKRGIESPDRFDALVLAFLPKDGGYKHIVEGYTPIGSNHMSFDIDWGKHSKHRCLHYGAMCLKEDMGIDIMCAVWNEVKGKLYVYDELSCGSVSPSYIVDELVERMKLNEYELTRMIGNDLMMSEGRRTTAKEINRTFWSKLSYHQHVKVRAARKYDPFGSMAILNDLVNNNMLVIHTKCKEINRQLSTWKLEKGKVKSKGMREGLLLIVSELVKNVPLKEIIKHMEYVTRSPGLPQPKKVEVTYEEVDK